MEAAVTAGEEALAAEEYEKAFEAFTVVAVYGGQQQPQSLQHIFAGVIGRARALAGMREFEAAERELRQVIDAQPNYLPALIARGEMYLEQGLPDLAQLDFEAVLREARGNIQAQFGLGRALAQQNQWQPAIRALTRVIEAQPENAEAYRYRGMAYNGLFKLEQAVADLQKSISLDPNEHEAYFWLAVTHLRQENYAAAVEQFGNAIERYTPPPEQEDVPPVQAHLARSAAYIELGKKAEDEATKNAAYAGAIAEAERLLQQLDERNPNYIGVRAATLYSRGVGERMAGELHQAIHSFSEAIRLNPQLNDAYFRRGICYHLLGEDRMAIADFVAAANLAYDDPRANLWEGFTYARQGNYLEAIRAYSDAIAASDRYAPAYFNRGLTYVAMGDLEKALADFDDAIRFEPANAEYYFQRGLVQARLGNYEQASESFARAIQLNSRHEPAHRHMAEALQRLGRQDAAGEYREKARELAPPQNTR